MTPVTLSSSDAYAGMCSAFRHGSYVTAAVLSRVLLRTLEAGRLPLQEWEARVPTIAEIGAESVRRLKGSA